MKCRTIIVIGASAGGVEALMDLFAGLPKEFPAALCVALHIGARPSVAPQLFSRVGSLPVAFATDGETLRPGRVYMAPPDHHLLVMPEQLQLSRGPQENRTRPAVDPLFRSAALAYGPKVIGVILSGMLSDGTAGLGEIKRQGGTTVVQDPREARYSGMPKSALENVQIDHCISMMAMGALLTRLVLPHAALSETRPVTPRPDADVTDLAMRDLTPDLMEDANMDGDYTLDQPVALTCPSCGGAMRETAIGSSPYYICHIGHRFAAGNMDAAQFDMLDLAMGTALRALNERATLCRRMAASSASRNHPKSAQSWTEAAAEAEERAQVLRRFLQQDWIRPSPVAE
jgi:two-component system chemotaxis response regulator CheB